MWTGPKGLIRPPGAQRNLQRKLLVVGVYNNTVNEFNAKKYTRCRLVVIVTKLIVGGLSLISITTLSHLNKSYQYPIWFVWFVTMRIRSFREGHVFSHIFPTRRSSCEHWGPTQTFSPVTHPNPLPLLTWLPPPPPQTCSQVGSSPSNEMPSCLFIVCLFIL